jgi:hypothetical protein
VFSKAEAIKIALIRGMDKEDALMVASNLTNKTQYSEALQEAVLNG